MPDLAPGLVLMVDGVPFEGTEARGLPGGARSVHVVAHGGELVFRRRVLVADDERVELDITNGLAPEIGRGPIPERTPAEIEAVPQLLVVGAVEWNRVRLHLDGAPMELDPDTRTFRRRLAPGPHRLERLLSGKPRPPVTLEVTSSPWQCAIARDGSMECMELVAPPENPVDRGAVDDALARMPAHERLRWLIALDASMTCADVARWMEMLYGDEEKMALAGGVRSKVVDPWNHVQLTRTLSFPESRRRVEAMYRGQVEEARPVYGGGEDPDQE